MIDCDLNKVEINAMENGPNWKKSTRMLTTRYFPSDGPIYEKI